VSRFIKFGASPRAAIGIANAARAAALLAKKPNVGFDEVRAVAPAALAHRLILGYEASLERVTSADVVARLVAAIPEVARA
jgi:MoxR-like ATPase